MSRILDFIREHIVLVIGVVLYIAVTITGIFVTPWDIEINPDEAYQSFGENSVMTIMPFDFLFSGIAEFVQAIKFIEAQKLENTQMLFFVFTFCAVATFLSALKHLILDGADYFTDGDSRLEDLNFAEKAGIDFLYDNVTLYAASVLVRFTYLPLFDWYINLYNSSSVFAIILTVLVLILIIIPMLPTFLYVLGYTGGLSGIGYLTALMGANMAALGWLKNSIIIVAAVIMILLLNFIGSKLLDFLQSKSILLIGNIFESVFSGVKTILIGAGVIIVIIIAACLIF